MEHALSQSTGVHSLQKTQAVHYTYQIKIYGRFCKSIEEEKLQHFTMILKNKLRHNLIDVNCVIETI